MNAAVVKSFDAPPLYTSFGDPAAGQDEVVVTVSAVGLHQVVKSMANGSHYASAEVLPLVPGVDGVGRLEDGTRVFFGASRPPYGSFAERCVTRPFLCQPIPENLDDAIVAAIVNPGMSSWAALTLRAQFVAGESVLVLGATGVAGKLAVQVAKRLGARRVIAAGRNPKALEQLEDLGADAVISLNQAQDAVVTALRRELADNKIDIVLDYVWGAPAERVLEAISQKGSRAVARLRFVQIGAVAGPTITLPSATLRSSGLEMMGSGMGSASLEKLFQALADFLREAATKPFRVEIRTAPLSEVGDLWDRAGEGVRTVFRP